MLYLQSYRNPGLVVDMVEGETEHIFDRPFMFPYIDIRLMNSQSVFAANTGMIILGGGVCKHHICNANLMRNGADFSVFINTAQEYDGCDSGARPDEAVSWGKIKKTASPVKVKNEPVQAPEMKSA